MTKKGPTVKTMYGQDTPAQSLQKHVFQTTFVKILKVEMVTARDDVSIKMSTSYHTWVAQP